MAVAGRSVGEALVSIAGREAVRDDGAALAAAAIDGICPSWVVRPGSMEQLSRVLSLAHDARLAVIPRGSGEALELGRPPARGDLVVDLPRLARVLAYTPAHLTVPSPAPVA